PRLVNPPTYQRKVGGCDSNTRSHLRNHGKSSAARSHKASGSRRPDSSQRAMTGVIKFTAQAPPLWRRRSAKGTSAASAAPRHDESLTGGACNSHPSLTLVERKA